MSVEDVNASSNPTNISYSSPYYYANYLLFSLKNSRFNIQQHFKHQIIPQVFFIQYILFSLDVSNFIFQQIAACNSLAQHKLSPLLYAEYAQFQRENWGTLEQVIRGWKQPSKDILLEHIDTIEGLLELWEEYIRKNNILSFC